MISALAVCGLSTEASVVLSVVVVEGAIGGCSWVEAGGEEPELSALDDLHLLISCQRMLPRISMA